MGAEYSKLYSRPIEISHETLEALEAIISDCQDLVIEELARTHNLEKERAISLLNRSNPPATPQESYYLERFIEINKKLIALKFSDGLTVELDSISDLKKELVEQTSDIKEFTCRVGRYNSVGFSLSAENASFSNVQYRTYGDKSQASSIANRLENLISASRPSIWYLHHGPSKIVASVFAWFAVFIYLIWAITKIQQRYDIEIPNPVSGIFTSAAAYLFSIYLYRLLKKRFPCLSFSFGWASKRQQDKRSFIIGSAIVFIIPIVLHYAGLT